MPPNMILDYAKQSLTTLPNDLLIAKNKNVTILFLPDNHFTTIPTELSEHYPKLSMIGFKNNRLDQFPVHCLPYQTLAWLILTNNRIPTLPSDFGRYQQLRKCMLSGNRLTSLPDSFSECHNLELLRLANNRLEHIPELLFQLPKLRWIALAANPCCPFPPSNLKSNANANANNAKQFHDHNSTLVSKIGEGASGEVWSMLHEGSRYACKQYTTHSVGSDGAPMNELYMLNHMPPDHDNLVSVVGSWVSVSDTSPNEIETSGDDAGAPVQGEVKGVVMQLLEGYRTIGLPPNFDTVTMDRFVPETDGPLLDAKSVIAQIQSAMEALHSKQIIHGDVYAHNVMVNDAGHAILTDLGASFYVTDPVDFEKFRTIEQRAFEVFRTDMRTHFTKPGANGCDVDVNADAGAGAKSSSCAEPLDKRPKK